MYLGVDDGSHPEALAGPGDRQHGPQEDGDGEDQRDAGRGHHVVDDDDQVAHELGVSDQDVVEGVAQLQEQGLPAIELVRLVQFLVIEHPLIDCNNDYYYSYSVVLFFLKILFFAFIDRIVD